MNPRLLMEGRLAEILPEVANIKDPENGFYILYAPRGTISFEEDMRCAVILSLREEDEEFEPDVAVERNLEAAYIISDAQNVIEVAQEDKPDANISDLVKALNYYMDNDAFIDFSQQ